MTGIRTVGLSVLASLGLLAGMPSPAQARWVVGVNIGVPLYAPYYRPYYGYAPYYYYPYYPYRAVYVQPAPVYVQPAPVVVPGAPAVQPLAQVPPPPPPASTGIVARSQAPEQSDGDVERRLQLLSSPDDQVRADNAIALGKLKASRAVDSLTATLAGDRSPTVREAAARALGLIGSSKALTALQNAALADTDRDVRNSARFAIDVIQAGR